MRRLKAIYVAVAVVALCAPVSIMAGQEGGAFSFELILLRLDKEADELRIDDDVRALLEPDELRTLQTRDDLAGRVSLLGQTTVPIWVELDRRAVVMFSRRPTEAIPVQINHPAESSVLYLQYLNNTASGYEWHVYSSTRLRLPLYEAARNLVFEARGSQGSDLWFTTTDADGSKVEGLACVWKDDPTGSPVAGQSPRIRRDEP